MLGCVEKTHTHTQMGIGEQSINCLIFTWGKQNLPPHLQNRH